MVTQFPNMIDWINEFGLDELHNEFEKSSKLAESTGMTTSISFSSFVDIFYKMKKLEWEHNMRINFRFEEKIDENGEIDFEIGKYVISSILNHAIANDIKDKILKEELCPDYQTAVIIVDVIENTILPKIREALKGVDE
jgi:hypothetical protein